MSNANHSYRLGIDVGSNSLGWFVVWLNAKGEAIGLGPGGVRIYPDGRDPKSKESNAADRRLARGMRRRRDRYLKRRTRLMALLVEHGLMPLSKEERKALELLDPYELRARALDQALPAHHVGRALFHLNQRRGFLSNRKTEKKKKDNEKGAIKLGADNLNAAMATSGARSLGEFLYGRHRERLGVRARSRPVGTKVEYEFYPTRQMLLDEFGAIWHAQAKHHPVMTETARAAIAHQIFFQRELKQPPVGKCSLDPAQSANDADGFRCSWAHPLAQRFRIWQEVRNLAITETGKAARKLSKEEGDKIALALFQNGKVSFDKMRALLKLGEEARFNLESARRDHLPGDETAARLAHKSLEWRSIPLARQIEIVSRLEDEADEAALVAWLSSETGIDADLAERVADALLPDGYCRLGLRAIRNILPHFEAGLDYAAAAKAAGYDHALLPDGELSLNGRLPYYGEWLQNELVGTGDPRDNREKRWGRFPNPTVHIGLGQLRRIVNALIADLGAPAEIAIEMARDFKLSPKQLAVLEAEQTKNQRKNEARVGELAKNGQPDNARNRMKLRLWEELNERDPLDRRCPYTGEVINIKKLLSEETDIDHLIPFSDCLDDSAANKIVCLRRANRDKGKRTPFEAFGPSSGSGYDWELITMLAANLPKPKQWRFGPDARQRFDAQGGFLARQLNETGWLARMAKQYLCAVADPYRIHVLPGKMTAMIRAKWGLNNLLPDHNFSDAKNRKDHRHHAIDAMVAALTDRKLLQRVASAYDDERQKIDVPLPWAALRDDLDAALRAMTVSHRPDHGQLARGSHSATLGKLHEDTAYGRVKHPENEDGNLVYRKNFRDLNDKEIGRIRDRRLRDLVAAHIAEEAAAGRDFKTALQSFAARRDIPGLPGGIRHVRLLKTEKPEYLVGVPTEGDAPIKFYSAGENAFVDIVETADGKWVGEAVSVYSASQPTRLPAWRQEVPGPRFVMRLHKGDLVALERSGARTVMLVRKLSAANNVVFLAPHNEAGQLQSRHDDKSDPFRWLMASYSALKESNAERVRVDELGRVWRIPPDEALRSL
ncbi:type II CRISPR RNA-guided endonuclease Cas9 [Dongia sp.]|uniref:type II CRISPR RNA-guided endonuclease Cas9 n=1 Tax=Dongia sp. TaxID=1977262 RepID=UPI0035B17E63